jgi:transcriptional antiterminator RfaH
MTAASWFVVRTQPHAEEKAVRHLTNQGFSTYLPRYRRRVRHARRVVDALRPLFPGYLFVRLDRSEMRWRSINGTIGVLYVLTDGDLPRCVPDRIVDEIRGREDDSGAVKLLSRLKRGQPVRLVQGPLADVDGLFEEIRDDQRVVLLFSLLGREVRTVVSAEDIVAA